MKKRMGSWKEIESHALQRRACFTSLDFWDERDEDNDFDKGDDSANGRLFGKVSDIANTGRDATHMIWNPDDQFHPETVHPCILREGAANAFNESCECSL
ncbi:hypothetical protein RJZ57_003030 [Blastomyces gilchristii]